MDPELKQRLEEIHALTKDNHRMLRAMRRDAWFTFFGRLLIWVAAFALSVYAFQHYLEPYLGNLPTSAEIQKLVDFYKTQM